MSLRKWRRLLGLLQSITPAVSGLRGMFTRVQNYITRAAWRHVHLTADVHHKLEAWRDLVSILARSPTHLRELQHFLLTGWGRPMPQVQDGPY